MANEITVTASLVVLNGSLSISRSLTKQVNQSVAFGGGPGTVAIGTAAGGEVVPFTDYTAKGYCLIINNSAANFVQVGPESGGAIVPLLQIGPQEFNLVSFAPTAVVRAMADTASCNVQFIGADR
jgi:hypothetical protein